MIDLSQIGAFSFVGTSEFSHNGPEVRYEAVDELTPIFADVDGDGVSDFHIQLTGAIALTAQDFHI